MPERVDEYELIRLLGHGAMGQVYQAVDTLLGRPVAVKFIAHESPSDTARERFLIEARAIARLQHPNVVSIYRVGVTQGRPYLVSELVRGQSLDSVQLPMPWTRVLNIAVQLARGLAAAHLQGVLHRDLKPGKVRSEGGHQSIFPRRSEASAKQGLRCGTIPSGKSGKFGKSGARSRVAGCVRGAQDRQDQELRAYIVVRRPSLRRVRPH